MNISSLGKNWMKFKVHVYFIVLTLTVWIKLAQHLETWNTPYDSLVRDGSLINAHSQIYQNNSRKLSKLFSIFCARGQKIFKRILEYINYLFVCSLLKRR